MRAFWCHTCRATAALPLQLQLEIQGLKRVAEQEQAALLQSQKLPERCRWGLLCDGRQRQGPHGSVV